LAKEVIFYLVNILSQKTLTQNAATKMTGVDVMITIFCDFCQFSAKKLRFSQKPML
jgi:hypothetical protein